MNTIQSSRLRGPVAIILPAVLLALATPRVEADSVATRIAAAQKAGTPTWLTWSVPSVIDGIACCWNGRGSRESQVCSLASNSWGMNMSRDKDGAPQIDSALVVYAHVESGAVDKVRVFSSSCRVDRGAEKVQEIASVNPAESVAYLEGLVKGGDADRAAKRRGDGALSAIALHDDKSADIALERVAKGGETREIRHSAAFWLGNTRDRPGYNALVRLRTSEDASFREHLTFCFPRATWPKHHPR